MKLFSIIAFLVVGTQVTADIVVTNRTIRPGKIITAQDLSLIAANHLDAYSDPLDVVGQEARVALYPKRPIRFDQIGPPALIERNQIVTLKFVGNTLAITTEGRSLERGAVGDRVRIMNLSSRSTVFGQIQSDGTIQVVH